MSLTSDMQQVDRRVKAALRAAQYEELNREETKLTKELRQLLNETRLDVRDYEYAESREHQLRAKQAARKNLMIIEKHIVQLGNVFGAADVAELSAHIDQIRDRLT